MPKTSLLLNKFNRGIISDEGDARRDVERAVVSARTMENFEPSVLGSMQLRPGLEYISDTYQGKYARLHVLSRDSDNSYAIELTDKNMRVMKNDKFISYPAVSTLITNGQFTSNINGWRNASDTGAWIGWSAGGGFLNIKGTGYGYGRAYQNVTVDPAEYGVEHAVKVVIKKGNVGFMVGTSVGKDSIVAYAELGAGTHVFSFYPNSNFTITLESMSEYVALVDECDIMPAGDLVIPTLWSESDIDYVRTDYVGDIMYAACRNIKPQKILRWGDRSWGVADYLPDDGAFRNINTTGTSVTVSALNGDINLYSSTNIFKPSHVGGLMRISSVGQTVQKNISSRNVFTDTIRVTGAGSARTFRMKISGSFTGTVTLQRSFDEGVSWFDVYDYTAPYDSTHTFGYDNQIVLYRLGVKSTNTISGTATCLLDYSAGSISGIVRIHDYVSPNAVYAHVLKPLGSTNATTNWEFGEWSEEFGYPSACLLHHGRLIMAGKGKVWVSAADAYESFDDEIEGDAVAFSKIIPSGTTENVNFMLSLGVAMICTDTSEWYLRSTSFKEKITISNAVMVSTSDYGAYNTQGVKVDNDAIYAGAAGKRIMRSSYNLNQDDMLSVDISKIISDELYNGVRSIFAQASPDNVIHFVMNDGKVIKLTYDAVEEIKAFSTLTTDGVIECGVALLSNKESDDVYYVVKRTVNGVEKRYIEKMAYRSDTVGGVLNKQLDSFIVYSGSAATVISGLDHLEGKAVSVWGDGRYIGDYTVSGGSITLSTSVSNAVVGLSYDGLWQSGKLFIPSRSGVSMFQSKIIYQIAFSLSDTHAQAIEYGNGFSAGDLSNMPLFVDGIPIKSDDIITDDTGFYSFDDEYKTDPRIYIKVKSPKPCKIKAIAVGIEMGEKNDTG